MTTVMVAASIAVVEVAVDDPAAESDVPLRFIAEQRMTISV